MQVKAVNETSFLITLGDVIDLELTAQIAQLVTLIESEFSDALKDITPSYTTLLVEIDLLKIAPLVAEQTLIMLVSIFDKKIDKQSSEPQDTPSQRKLIELPVCYDTSVGWDLQKVASDKHLSIAEVIRLHSEKTYQVCAVGFAPGFAFLAQVDDKIMQARHTSPRLFVPAGSVAIADKQTAVYPSDSPGGWHIIGNCPLPLFDINQLPISPFNIGDRVKFNVISLSQFIALGGKVSHE